MGRRLRGGEPTRGTRLGRTGDWRHAGPGRDGWRAADRWLLQPGALVRTGARVGPLDRRVALHRRPGRRRCARCGDLLVPLRRIGCLPGGGARSGTEGPATGRQPAGNLTAGTWRWARLTV